MYGVGGGGGGFNAPSTTAGRRRNPGDEEEEEEEESGEGRVLEAWERAYADERSWESLQEDESGLLRPIDTKTLVHAQYRRRLLLRSAAGAAARIQKGLIRYLYIVIDLSRVRSLRFMFSVVRLATPLSTWRAYFCSKSVWLFWTNGLVAMPIVLT
jgi:transcription initiation factor TFIIH subunit 2